MAGSSDEKTASPTNDAGRRRPSFKRRIYKTAITVATILITIFAWRVLNVLAFPESKGNECLSVTSVPSSVAYRDNTIYRERILIRNTSRQERYVVGVLKLEPTPVHLKTIPERVQHYCHFDTATGMFRLLMNVKPDSRIEPIQPSELVTIEFADTLRFSITDTANLHLRFKHYRVQNSDKGNRGSNSEGIFGGRGRMDFVGLLVVVIALFILVFLAHKSEKVKLTVSKDIEIDDTALEGLS